MAYVSAQKISKYTSAATSTTGVLPAHESGDLLIAIFKMRNGSDDFTTPSGWTAIAHAGSGSISAAAYYLVATSSSETNPVSTHTSATYHACTCVVVKDAPSSSPIDTSASSAGYNSSANTRASRSATTTGSNELLLHSLTEPQWRQSQPDPGPMVMYREFFVDGAFSDCMAWTFEESSGAYTPFNWRKIRGSSDDVTMVIAIKSDAGLIPARSGAACSTPVFCGADGGYYGYTINDVSSTLTAIDGVTTTNNPAGASSDPGAGFNPYSYAQRFQGTLATSGYQAVAEYEFDAGPYSVSSKKFCISWSIGSGVYAQRVDSLENNGIVLGLRSGTNEFIAYRAGGNDAAPKETTAIVFDDNTSGIGHTGGGTFDETDVQGLIVSVGNASQTAYANVDQFHIMNDITIIGGRTDEPEGWGAAYDIAVSANIPTVEKLGEAYQTKQDITVGDGSSTLNFATNGQSLFLAGAASVAAKNVEMQAAGVAVTLYGVSGDSISINDPIVSTGNPGDSFNIDGSSTPDANWDFDGGLVAGFPTVSLRDIGAGAYAGFTISACAEVTHNDSDLTGGLTISGCTGTQAITVTGATEAALQSAIDNLAGVAFSGSTTYALTISFTGTGDVDLVGPAGMTFASSGTADIHYTSTSASELTFTPGSGTTVNSTAYSGSATGVTVDASTAITLSAPNIIDDTRYQIYNVTQDNELYNGIVSGGSGISINTTIGTGLDIESGDELELSTGYNDAANYKEPTRDSIIANTSSNVWTRTQVDWDVVESYGLDGSDYDYTASGGTGPFEADFSDDETDYELTSNFSGASFGAWIGYILTTEEGIRNWYGAFTFIDAANIRINDVSTSISGLFDNQTTSEVYQTDSIRIFLESGNRPVKNPSTGGGGVDVNWKNQVYLQTTGSGALTSAQATQLSSAATQAASAASNTSSLSFTGSRVDATIGAEVLEGAETMAETLRILRAVLAGEVSGAGSGTEVFKSADGNTDRVTSTVDSDGNRTAVTVDGS